MKVAIIHNKDKSGVINKFGMQNKERYNPKTVNLVAEALERGGHNVQIIDGNMQVIESLREFMPRVIEGERMGMVFNMAYGIQGESRYTHLPSMLEMLGIPYVGSGPQGHALALDKVMTKIVMQQHGIPTPKFWVFSNSSENMSSVEYPIIVKPKMEAVSYGLKVVDNEEELRKAVDFIVTEFQQQALVEQFIRGREFAIGLLGNDNPEAFPVLEIDLEGDPNAIQSAEDKLRKPRNKICPADISQKLSDEMVRLSKEAFKVLGLRDFARVDIRIDENNNIYILEINSMASLGRTGAYIYAANIAGYDYPKLINRILDIAVVRYFSDIPEFSSDGDELLKEKAPLSVRVRTYLRSKEEDVVKLLAEMVNINAYVRNVEDVNALGYIVRKQLGLMDFTYKSIPQVEIGNIQLLSNTDEDEYDILFLSHLDNPVSLSRHNYFKESGHRLYGTGIWDNKGGIAAMIASLRALRFARLLRNMRIGILLTTDESIQGKVSKKTVEDISSRAKVVFGLNGSSPDGSLVLSRSGVVAYKIEMNLVKADKTTDVTRANSQFTRLLNNLIKLSSEADGVILNPSEVKISSNIQSQYAYGEATLNVRFISPDQAKIYDEKVQHLVKMAKSTKVKIHISGVVRRDPMVRNQGTDMLFNRAKKIGDRLDLRILDSHRWHSSHICFVGSDIPKLDGLGPIGDAPPDGKEYIFRYSLMDRATLIALLLEDLVHKGDNQ